MAGVECFPLQITEDCYDAPIQIKVAVLHQRWSFHEDHCSNDACHWGQTAIAGGEIQQGLEANRKLLWSKVSQA